MSGLILDRTASPAHARLSAPRSQWVVLVAVAFGVLFGALACVAGMAGGVAHGATQPSVVENEHLSMAHAGHLGPEVARESHSPPLGDHGDHSGSATTGNHPGMACVMLVDLHTPEASSASNSDAHEILLPEMNTGCPADVDPPVPRCS